jgi:hypothetical protein
MLNVGHCEVLLSHNMNGKPTRVTPHLNAESHHLATNKRSVIFLFTTALGPTQPPIQWEPGAFSLGIKRPGREAGHSPPSSAEVKE